MFEQEGLVKMLIWGVIGLILEIKVIFEGMYEAKFSYMVIVLIKWNIFYKKLIKNLFSKYKMLN